MARLGQRVTFTGLFERENLTDLGAQVAVRRELEHALQSLCDLGQSQLMQMEYLAAEKTLVEADRLATKLEDLDTLGRLYMPLQEARNSGRACVPLKNGSQTMPAAPAGDSSASRLSRA